jgi:two-component system chemotaxis sensor kinase CheA
MSDEQERLARRRVTFVQDAGRRLAALSDSLLVLERDPADRAALNEARRALHTLKGNAGLVGLGALAATAHTLEDALADVSTLPSPVLLLRGLDVLSAMVASVAESVGQSGPSIPIVEALKSPIAPPLSLEGMGPTPSPALPLLGEGSGSPRFPEPQSSQITASVRHLDSLLELVEELRLAHSELAQSPREMLERHLARQRRLLHELHNTVLETRLLPVGRAFGGFERLVRDLAEGLGYQAVLLIKGAETEIDRSALDPVRELVVHLLRNALAHGIEPPEEREAVGKPPTGTIRLAARQEGDGVVIDVTDDGRGLERQRIASRAVALGLCSEQEATALADTNLWAFLTRPGFSTQDSVDQVAGRGIGLYAVRQGVESLRGRLEIESQPGQSTTVRLRLPAMMALEDVVLISVGMETYAIPEAVVDGAQPAAEAPELPTLDLWERLRVPGDGLPAERMLLLCRRSDGPIGLLADGVASRETAVIKPLPRRTRRPDFLGAIVTGTGRVVLVLDIEQLQPPPTFGNLRTTSVSA